jgi:hypothetical protein
MGNFIYHEGHGQLHGRRRYDPKDGGEVGRKPLLRFLHSPHPCGLAMQGAIAESNAGSGCREYEEIKLCVLRVLCGELFKSS